MSQLALAAAAEVSPRHVSFVETGRAEPSREMVMTLARALDVPLRERNAMLAAAAYAPIYRETSLDDPQMAEMRRALLLRQHDSTLGTAQDITLQELRIETFHPADEESERALRAAAGAAP